MNPITGSPVCHAIQPAFARESNDPASAQEVRDAILASARTPDNVDFIVTPEYANSCGLNEPALLGEAAGNTAFLEELSAIAAEKSAYLLACVVSEEGGRLYNRAILYNRSGHRTGHYDKLHLTVEESDTMTLTPGEEPVVFGCDFGRVGVAICFDLYFPLLFEVYRSAGVGVIAAPSYQRNDPRDTIQAQMKMRAIDSGAYLIRSSYYYNNSTATCGCSGVYAPDGGILSQLHGPGSCSAQLHSEKDCGRHHRSLMRLRNETAIPASQASWKEIDAG